MEKRVRIRMERNVKENYAIGYARRWEKERKKEKGTAKHYEVQCVGVSVGLVWLYLYRFLRNGICVCIEVYNKSEGSKSIEISKSNQ